MPVGNMKDIKTEIIDSTEKIEDLVDWLVFRHAPPDLYSPTMYIDLEGVDLCREGSISILTLLIDTGIPTKRVCLIDVHTLGAKAFESAGAKQKTLKDILQDAKIPKVFFDVRNDSDALFAHFGVALQGVEDVQLMESATRKTTASRKLLSGLAKCVENSKIGHSGLASWKLAKEKGERLFKAEHGGSYEIFNQRPIPEDVISYCAGDVQFLPDLWNKFCRQQAHAWRDMVDEETEKRVAMSQRSDYQPHDRKKAMGPWSKDQNLLLDQWNYVAPLDHYDDTFDQYDDDLEDDWYDDGPTSCRDIISSWDYDYYYSD
ncbi:ribonuclease H-like domain-containing protein [Lophiotrema nucula]|uniref:Ribonuclease H-like domain-containing protein n=1 Tax=Lophiotrema nucula TaxID=690887 RepID=A0A6A5Z563_9PLEO|nr:ribonuclease H-like domain-containing protein [Lophiotrema nucula]